MAPDYRYCPNCRTPLVRQRAFDRQRPVCPACGFIQFNDPKVAVIGLVTSQDRVLLVRRGVDPGKGQWALPGGFMDAGEMPGEALARELAEEVGLQVEVGPLLGIYPMAPSSRVAGGIVLAYLGTTAGEELPTPQTNDDVDKAAWFRAGELPEDMAFASSKDLLERWRAGELDA